MRSPPRDPPRPVVGCYSSLHSLCGQRARHRDAHMTHADQVRRQPARDALPHEIHPPGENVYGPPKGSSKRSSCRRWRRGTSARRRTLANSGLSLMRRCFKAKSCITLLASCASALSATGRAPDHRHPDAIAHHHPTRSDHLDTTPAPGLTALVPGNRRLRCAARHTRRLPPVTTPLSANLG
jgi:hypothetical protein